MTALTQQQTAVMSMIEFWQCYRSVAGQAHIKATYPGAHWQETSRLAARQLGLNHALLILIRIYGGMYVRDPGAYRVCHLSFVMIFVHFMWERFGPQTVGSRNLSSTEVIAFITTWYMFVVESEYTSGKCNPSYWSQ